MKKYFLFLGLSTVITTIALVSCKNGGGDTVALKFNFQPGSKYQYTMSTKLNIEQTVMGASIKIGQDMLMASTYTIAAADGSNKKISVNYDRIAMKSDNNYMPMEFDSADSTKQNDILKGIGKMINQPFNVVVSEKGEVISVEGLDKVINGMVDTTKPNQKQQKALLSQQMSDSSVKASMQQSFNVYPDKPVKPGDIWTKTYTVPMANIIMKVESEYKLTSIDKGIAHIDVNSKMTSLSSTNPAMKELKIEMTGTQKGTTDMEISSGLITSNKLIMDIKGKLNVTGTEVPMNLNGTITLTGIKK
ncbi:MAG: DUF6263 family protein [Bacteroidota bacterium]